MSKIFFKHCTRVRLLIKWLMNQEGTPAQRARGLAVGVFSGCFPFFGFQTIIGIFLASLFKGNHLLAAAGTWVSNPVTYVPLYLFNYKVGSVFLGEGANLEALNQLSKKELFEQGWLFSSRLLLGSSVFGLLLGLLVGLLSYGAFRSISTRHYYLKKH